MATLALAAAGAAVGSALLPAGVTILGASLTGAAIGSQVGALAGAYVDQALLGAVGGARTAKGPRLSELRITGSSEGSAIPRLYGRARLGGQLIWATDFEEEVKTTSHGGGGLLGALAPETETTEYRYYASFAVALCEGEIAGIGRVWADGTGLDLSTVTYRLHTGSETQAPDALIEAHEGAGDTPAYRGIAYIVFERMPLADFGNRIPQLSFEVHRAVDSFNASIRAVTLIPGAGEFAYAQEPVTRRLGFATNVSENVHTRQGATDWSVALDQLQATLPNVTAVNLIVGWFGTDLSAGACEIRPGVDSAFKLTQPLTWRVAGLGRGTAHLVSEVDGRAAYGGTPSDQTVIGAIRDLKARGFTVTLTPFVFMDIPAGNALTDPYTGATGQPAYPWRGRITVSPAPGQPGSPDKTAASATQVAAFVGTASPADFAIDDDDDVAYSGPDEWSYRRFILHYACLAKAAGVSGSGVDAFVIGSEMRGLTTVRDGGSSYPFVAALASIATDAKAVLGAATRLTYAADWSEYFGHQPNDGSGDVHFHLDPLWSSPAIDAIGLDVYWPLADWRDGADHLDAEAGARSVHDLDYLKGNLIAGEGYDWHYATPSDREAQLRTPISDGLGKPWVFRFKDLRAWWLNLHYDRPGGIESATPTAWVPQSKPFWIMELGCPAVDRGANQPNVFVDPKSSESHLPYFSHGKRDDLMQRRYLQAFHDGLDPAREGTIADANPVSSVYAGHMVDLDRLHVYCWDARPHPAFPADTDAWGDGANWRLGHWLTGRMANAPLGSTIAAVLADHGFPDYDVSAVDGMLGGLLVDRILSARETLQPLDLAFFLDARESGGRIVFAHRSAAPLAAELTPDNLVETRPEAALASLTRAQETDLPAVAKLTFISGDGDYAAAVEEARRLAGRSQRVALADVPLVLDAEQAAGIAEIWLHEAWAARERAHFTLPPSRLALEPGDAVRLAVNGRSHLLRITEVGEHGARDIDALSLDLDIYAGAPVAGRAQTGSVEVLVGQPFVAFLDLPLLRGDEPPAAGYVAAAQIPWPGPIAIYRSADTVGFQLHAIAAAPAITGVTLDPLPAGATSRFDRATAVRVALDSGTLTSVPELALLGGANAAAIRNDDGDWEVVQFLSATLTAPAVYLLTGFLRGQAGTEHAMRAPLPAGARFVLLGSTLARIDLTEDEIGLAYNWRAGPASRDLGASNYVQITHAFAGTGLEPLAPVHLRAIRSSIGDLSLTWIRRTRIGGDSWEAIEVPLGEAEERYEIDILDGAAVKRTLAVSTPAATYTAAEQTADFGAPQPSLSLRLYQMSATRGRGWDQTVRV
ncbi:MAG TPA: glycoside hydrolase/phage tail family protein [Hyphomicrobiaceae bacterium]|nr:glycoside hydrolase/phage tail family protein [Hyphomicrobiaceae bacterium]